MATVLRKGIMRGRFLPDFSSKHWASFNKSDGPSKIQRIKYAKPDCLFLNLSTDLQVKNLVTGLPNTILRNYVLNYLATRPKLATFVTQALIQLYARITKLGWFDCQKDDYVFRNAITDVTRFLQDSVEYCIIGVTILSQLTNEINQVSATAFLIEADTTHPLTKHRKIASSFRDSSLFDIFTLSCNLLKQASGKNLNLNDESQHGLLMQLLKLTHNCLNFDFIGTSTDESSDDLCTVQIPTSWRSEG
ncbi:Exportin 7 [Saguinus oedipus]|uniref:Exportin 7 n=1 Tax=Saguinus oedipus TaxID=9490 RepID=A0ABQ9U9U2_SAGOE|nr:Exportin 7 [Saguinus oedipus]